MVKFFYDCSCIPNANKTLANDFIDHILESHLASSSLMASSISDRQSFEKVITNEVFSLANLNWIKLFLLLLKGFTIIVWWWPSHFRCMSCWLFSTVCHLFGCNVFPKVCRCHRTSFQFLGFGTLCSGKRQNGSNGLWYDDDVHDGLYSKSDIFWLGFGPFVLGLGKNLFK